MTLFCPKCHKPIRIGGRVKFGTLKITCPDGHAVEFKGK